MNVGQVNLRKIKIADPFPQEDVVVFSHNEGVSRCATGELLANKNTVIFSNPGVFVASYMASQIPTFEANFNNLKQLKIDDVYCLVNNDYFVVANYAQKFQIENIKFICDNSLSLSNSLGYLADLTELNLGYRCWPAMFYLVNGVVHKIFYEDFAVTPVDCYSATSCITLLKFLNEKNQR